MSDEKKPITAFKASAEPKAQQQHLPGLSHKMDPEPEYTKLEYWDATGTKPYLKEYVGTGKLEGKKAIITGGDSGIGRSVAIFFAREGADVSIVYLPEEQKDAESLRSEIPTKLHLIPSDLEDKSSYSTVIQSHLKEFGGQLDILVNNASKQIMCKDVSKLEYDNIESTFKSNILQMIHLTKEAVPHMKRGASIINTTSVTAYQGSPGLIDYSSTKGAIVSFTRALANQLAPKGIRVNGIAPGKVYTPLQPASREAEEMEGWGVGKVPLQNRVAQPSELAEAYVLLAGPGGNFITGSTIHLNGGEHVGGS